MKTLLRSAFLCSLFLGLAPAACASPQATADDVSEGSSELRALQADEILGQIHFGDEVAIDYTATPRYRAYWFEGTKGDWLDVQVTSSTGDVWAFVVDDQFQTVRRGTRAVLPKTGKYYIAVREGTLQPAKITVNFALTPAPAH
jgi:hypothetical protein